MILQLVLINMTYVLHVIMDLVLMLLVVVKLIVKVILIALMTYHHVLKNGQIVLNVKKHILLMVLPVNWIVIQIQIVNNLLDALKPSTNVQLVMSYFHLMLMEFVHKIVKSITTVKKMVVALNNLILVLNVIQDFQFKIKLV